jgi:aspartate/methionine/tyrosine aminotransferase
VRLVQRAGLTAVREGEPVIARTVARYRKARDFLVERLNAIDGIEAALPSGAMYVFFRVAGLEDSFDLCKRLVLEAGLGLAPGIAFGPEGEGYVRWCFATDIPRLEQGLERFVSGLERLRATPRARARA